MFRSEMIESVVAEIWASVMEDHQRRAGVVEVKRPAVRACLKSSMTLFMLMRWSSRTMTAGYRQTIRNSRSSSQIRRKLAMARPEGIVRR
jgi:hypothetical protein